MHDENVLKNNFLLWKKWTFEHEATPKRHSEDKEEDKLAARMSYTISIFRREPDKYSDMISEYARIYCMFNKRPVVKLTKLEVIDKWEEWVEANGAIPSAGSPDEKERIIAKRMQSHVARRTSSSNKNDNAIKRYNTIVNKYKYLKKLDNAKATYAKWKAWCKKHGRIPAKSSESKEEQKLTVSINNAMVFMRSEPDVFSNELKEYKKIKKGFISERRYKNFVEAFERWKKWVAENNRLPKTTSQDLEERQIAIKISSMISRIKGNPGGFEWLTKEYLNICYKYCTAPKFSSSLCTKIV